MGIPVIMSALASLLLLAAMGMLGVAALRRAVRWLDPLEQIAYGIPLGVVVASLVLLVAAIVAGLSGPLVVVVGFGCAMGAGLLWPVPSAAGPVGIVATSRIPRAQSAGLASLVRRAGGRISVLPAAVIGWFVVRWALLWSGALTYDEAGLWAGQINIWGDWAQHLGDVASFAYADNFPPMHPRYAGDPYAYHYLASLTAAAMVELGMRPTGALTLHSFLFSSLIAVGLYAFARRLTRDGAAAALALVLFLLGGGLGWLLVVGEVNRSHDLWSVLLQRPWDLSQQNGANFRWQNVYFSSIEPQRAFLYGLPLTLLTFTLLFAAVRTKERRAFAAAGVVAGLLPFAHLGPLPLLALVTPFLVLLFPSRGWLLFFGVWVTLTVPQLYLQEGGERGGATEFRILVGWLASPDPWLWFWLKNLGWFVPLLVFALADRHLLQRTARRFLWAFMPVFAIANLVVFQPDPWDNVKLLIYWFLAVCVLVAALLVRTWRLQPSPVVRVLMVGVVASMTLSGLLVNWHQVLGKDRYLLLTAEEIQLAELVRVETPPRALFAVGLQPNHPVPVLTGRPVLMSYPGWLWPRGVDVGPRERDLRAIYAYTPDAPRLLQAYGVDYVVIGPWERDQFDANETAFREQYPVVISTTNYAVFAVGSAASE